MTALVTVLLNMVWVVLLARVVADLVAVVVPAGAVLHDPVERVRCGLQRVSEPVLRPVRRVVPPVRRGAVEVDLSVVVVLLVVAVLRAVVGA